MRYRLRTLLIVLAVLPPVLAWCVWPAVWAKYDAWRWRAAVQKAKSVPSHGGGLVTEDRANLFAPMSVEVIEVEKPLRERAAVNGP